MESYDRESFDHLHGVVAENEVVALFTGFDVDVPDGWSVLTSRLVEQMVMPTQIARPDRTEKIHALSVVDVPEGLKSAVFPPMMLQTLVENAIKHGLEPKTTGGTLSIAAEIVDGQLAVHVIDDGMGFAPKAEGGVGLANIRERLKVMYKDRAELIISVPPLGGTCATIKVPYEVSRDPAL